MKTKIPAILFALTLCSNISFGQVVAEKSKSTLTGKNALLLEPIPESMLDHFTIDFYNYFYGCDQGGGSNSVCVEATLGNFDEKLAQEITDEAYSYFIEKWNSKGIHITCPTAADIEATKQFAKDKSKGKAEIRMPGSYAEGNKYLKYLKTIPSNTVQVRKEFYGNYMYGNAQYFPGNFSGNLSRVNFYFALNFIELKNGFGSTALIKGSAALKSTSSSSLVLWVKVKNLSAAYTTEAKGGTDFFDAFEEKDSKWIVQINREKYKANALEMIKKSIDSQLAAYDENVAKEK